MLKRPPLGLALASLLAISCSATTVTTPGERRVAYGHARPHGFSSSPKHADVVFAASTGPYGTELWRLAADQVSLVKDINRGLVGLEPQRSSHPTEITRATAMGPEVFFTAHSYHEGRELWYYDGQDARLVRDIFLGRESSNPRGLTMLGSRVVFSATDHSGGRELWWSDGTKAERVEIAPGKKDSSPTGFTVFQGRVFFSATDDKGDTELWWFDGTKTGSFNLDPNGSSKPMGFKVWLDNLWFTARSTNAGRRLWRYDGRRPPLVAQQTATLKMSSQLTPGPNHLAITSRGTNGKTQLYLIDRRRVLRKATSFARGLSIRELTWAGEDLFFVADGGTGTMPTDLRLWRIVKGDDDAQVVATGLSPRHLTPWKGGLLFSGDNGVIGREPWVWSRATNAQRPLRDIKTGPSPRLKGLSSVPSKFVPAGDGFVFAADGPGGRELWKTDGIDAWRVADIDSAEPRLPVLKVYERDNAVEFLISDAEPSAPYSTIIKHKLGPPLTMETVRGVLMAAPPDFTWVGGVIQADKTLSSLVPKANLETLPFHDLGIQGMIGPSSAAVVTTPWFCAVSTCTATSGSSTAEVEADGCVDDHTNLWNMTIRYVAGNAPAYLRLVKYNPGSGGDPPTREFVEDPGTLPPMISPGDTEVSAEGELDFSYPEQLELWIFLTDPGATMPDPPPADSCAVWKSYC